MSNSIEIYEVVRVDEDGNHVKMTSQNNCNGWYDSIESARKARAQFKGAHRYLSQAFDFDIYQIVPFSFEGILFLGRVKLDD